MLEKIFKLSENGTDVKTEIIAGITTFMTMAYILAVNPSIMAAAGMNQGAVFTATALSALIGAFCKLPICSCSWHGTECIFCLYCSSGNGL